MSMSDSALSLRVTTHCHSWGASWHAAFARIAHDFRGFRTSSDTHNTNKNVRTTSIINLVENQVSSGSKIISQISSVVADSLTALPDGGSGGSPNASPLENPIRSIRSIDSPPYPLL